MINEIRGFIGNDVLSVIIWDNEAGQGTFQEVRNVRRTGGSGAIQEMFLAEVNIDGTLGRVGVPHGETIQLEVIGSIIADAGITADLVAGPRDPDSGSTTSTITLVQTNGDLSGDVIAHYGNIDLISVGGDIGSATNFVAIESQGKMDNVIASEIRADIKTAQNGGSGRLGRLETTGGGFYGTLETTNLADLGGSDGMFIAGDLDAGISSTLDLRNNIVVSGDLTGDLDVGRYLRTGTDGGGASFFGKITVEGDMTGSITIGARQQGQGTGTLTDGDIVIGGSLSGSIAWEGDSDNVGALTSQVIINESNVGGTWTGSVAIDDGDPGTATVFALDDGASQPDQAPYYNRLSSDLGGGAVGLVPFSVHDYESTLINTGQFDPVPPADNIVIHHYGPVKIVGQTTNLKAIQLYERQAYTFPIPSWTPVADASYEVYDSSTDPDQNPVGEREVRVVYGFECGKQYKFVPEDDVLVCDDVTGSPDVDDYELLRLARRCKAERSMNGTFDSIDIAIQLSDPIDVNEDGYTDFADVQAVIDAVNGN